MHSGDTLYGTMKDITGRATMMHLAKDESVAPQVAEAGSQLCHHADGGG
jgi:hypothetical protein